MEIKELAQWIEANYSEEEINQYINMKQAEIAKIQAYYKESAALCQQAERLEKEGETLQAIVIYKGMLKNNFDGSRPYDRLAVLYKKLKRPDDVIRVLEKAVNVFENIVHNERADRIRKLEKYKNRLKIEKEK